jgi:serine carboxypeptidase 1
MTSDFFCACSSDVVRKVLLSEATLDSFMNTFVKEALGLPANVTWGRQSSDVFSYLSQDFMKPVTSVGKYKLEQFETVIHITFVG